MNEPQKVYILSEGAAIIPNLRRQCLPDGVRFQLPLAAQSRDSFTWFVFSEISKDDRKSVVNFRSVAAFTMIELLVTVAMIAVLAGLAFAAGLSALKTAQRHQCLGNMRQIGLATINYGNDNNLDYPIADNPAWDVALDPYLGNEPLTSANPVLKCPDDPRPLVNGGSFSRSYSFNGDLPAKSIQVTGSSQTIMIAEWYSGGTQGPGGAGANFQYGARFNRVVYSTGAVPTLGPTPGYHGSTSNFVFADGHAESLDPRTTVGTTSMWQ